MLRRRRRVQSPHAVSPAPFVGMILMAAAFFLYAVSGLVAPWWAVVLLLLVWLALFVLCTAWWTPHPRRLPYVGVGAIAFWFFALLGGGFWLGWGG